MKKQFFLNETQDEEDKWVEVSESEFNEAVHTAGFDSGVFQGTVTKSFSTDQRVTYRRGKVVEV
jgi:hypothetical protein